MADWQDYFSKTRPPSNLDEAKRTIQDFASKHRQLGRNIVLVTSGGTTVPIESNTVRFVDNFSQGTRGACSAEYFLMHGYAVIFLHRQRSYEPFCRHFEGHNALDLLELQLDTSGACRVTVDETRAPGLQDVVRRYKEVQNGCLLLKIGFMTLSDYLFLLKASAEALSPLGNHVMFYLAAAVSDFYIPDNELAEHKIQSSDSSFQLNMTPTPKMLSPLVKEWAKNAFVVSFKLETDVNIISRKAREALQRYNHQVVIANILQTRRKTVVLVTPTDESAIWMSDQDLEMGKEIEEKIVNELTRRHVALTNGPIETASQMSPVVQSNVSFSPQTQFSNQTSLIQNTLPNTAVSNNMPGLAPINVYQNNAVGVKTATIPNVLLQLKDGEYTTNSELLPTTLLKRSVSAKEDRCMLTPEMQEFIREFKRRRINLGYTQDDVGRELSALNGPTYSQSFISRFEGKQLGMKAAERMRPVLEGWIQTKEEEHGGRNKYSKKRRKRTSFPQDVLDILNDCFQKNSKPTLDEMQDIANKINRDLITVKVWFCNKKQSLRRSGHAVPGTFRSNSMKELGSKRTRKSEADITDVFPITQNAIKTLVPVSTSTGGAVTMPFFIQDGNTLQLVSGTPTNATQTNTQGGNTLATTLQQQQIVHLSQLPLLTSMAVMNNGLNATNPQTGGATAHVISNGRVLPNGTVIQISNNSLSQSHLTQNINNNNSNSISDGSVIIGSGDNDSSLNTSGQESTNGDIQLLAANEASLNSHIIAPHIRGETESEETESSAICLDNDGNKSNTMKQQENLLSRGVIERNVISISSK